MATYRDLLNSLYANCVCPIPVRIDGVEAATDKPDMADAPGGLFEIAAATCDGVAFLIGKMERVKRSEVENCLVTPTAAIFKDETMYVLWSLDELASVDAAARFVAEAGMEPVATYIPLPPSDGWELLYTDPQCFYSLERLRATYVERPEADVEEDVFVAGSLYQQARVLTSYAEKDYPQKIVVSSAGKKEATFWHADHCKIADLVRKLTEHIMGSKNGRGYVLAELIEGRRTKNAVKAVYAVGLDIDNGTPSEVIDRALVESGWLAVRYTTHSHGKITTTFKKDRITKFAPDEIIGGGLLRRFVVEAEGWDPTVAAIPTRPGR